MPAYRGDHRQGNLRSAHQPLGPQLPDIARRHRQGQRHRAERAMSARPITTIKTVVVGIEGAGTGIKVFTLADPDHWDLPPFKPGAHIDLHLPNGLVRTYSLCNEPADNSRYVIAVKREADGRGGSRALHDDVWIGDVFGVSLPRGGVELGAGIARHVF